MAFNQQIADIIKRLTTQSGKGKFEWEETADNSAFQTAISRFVVTVSYVTPSDWNEPNFYHLQILDREGKLVDSASATQSEEKDWKILENLHELARRRARHVDEALADLLSALE